MLCKFSLILTTTLFKGWRHFAVTDESQGREIPMGPLKPMALNLPNSPSVQFLMVGWPPTAKLFLLLLHTYNFSTVMNPNVNICYLTPYETADGPWRGQDPQVEKHCLKGNFSVTASTPLLPILPSLCYQSWVVHCMGSKVVIEWGMYIRT